MAITCPTPATTPHPPNLHPRPTLRPSKQHSSTRPEHDKRTHVHLERSNLDARTSTIPPAHGELEQLTGGQLRLEEPQAPPRPGSRGAPRWSGAPSPGVFYPISHGSR